MPLLTFINKWDRPGREPLELHRRDRAADRARRPRRSPGRSASPATSGASSTGARGEFIRFTRTARGSTDGPRGASSTPSEAAVEEGDAWEQAAGRDRAARRRRRRHRPRAVPGRRVHPGLLRLGAHQLRRRHAARRRGRPRASARPRHDVDGVPRPLDDPFSGFVFKVQANMDPSHRDRIAFLRVCSGHFERGMVVTHATTGKPFATKYAHRCSARSARRSTRPTRATSSAWSTPPTCASATPSTSTSRSSSPASPASPPSTSGWPGSSDTGRVQAVPQGHQPARRGRRRAGAARPDLGDQAPVLAAVGPMQFEVASHRLENEFGAPVEIDAHGVQGGPAHRRGERADPAGHERGRRAAAGPTAPATPCSRAPTGSSGSNGRTPTSPSTGSSPRVDGTHRQRRGQRGGPRFARMGP